MELQYEYYSNKYLIKKYFFLFKIVILVYILLKINYCDSFLNKFNIDSTDNVYINKTKIYYNIIIKEK